MRDNKFGAPVRRWTDIPGWFQWRGAQQEAVAAFDDGSVFVEVVDQAQSAVTVVGVDTGRGSGAEGQDNSPTKCSC